MFLDNCLGDSYVPPFEGIINQPTTAVPLGTSDWLSMIFEPHAYSIRDYPPREASAVPPGTSADLRTGSLW